MKKKILLLTLIIIGVLVICFIYKWNTDKKINWTEHLTSTSFIATFDYFNGNKKIDVYAKKGQVIDVKFLWTFHEGRVGISVLNSLGIPMDIGNENTSAKVSVSHDGENTIVIYGNNVTKGKLDVSWEVK